MPSKAVTCCLISGKAGAAQCRASHPHLYELYSRFKNKGFEIIGIASEHAKTANERHKLWSIAIAEDIGVNKKRGAGEAGLCSYVQ